MITLLQALPADPLFRRRLEQAAPAETAMLWAEAPLLGFGQAGLWQQTDPTGTVTALLLRNTVGGVTLAPLPQADPDELARFLQVVGWNSLTLPGSFAPLPTLGSKREEALLMEWTGGEFSLPHGLAAAPIAPAALLENTLAAFGDAVDPAAREEWLWAFALRSRRRTALALGLFCGEEPLAAAALSHVGPAAAMVAFVGTPPRLRGRGYGGTVAAAAAAHAAGLGLRPLLCCAPSLEGFYRRVGFRTVGSQTTLLPQ